MFKENLLRTYLRTFLMVSWLFPVSAMAAQRTFVSAGSGSDANPCTRQQPCRNFASAIAQTSAGGEVVVLDSGGYGVVTITQSVTLAAPPGVHAGITAISPTGNHAITVAASTSDLVVIRGLSIMGLPAVNGIRATSFGTLFIENCVIDNFGNYGILAEVSVDGSKVFVRDTIVRRGVNAGIQVITNTGTIYAWISNSRFDHNGPSAGSAGVFAGYGAKVVCNRCEANDNDVNGFRVFAHGGPNLFSEINCDGCIASGNQIGFFVEGQAGKLATLRLARSFVTGNSFAGVMESQTSAVHVLSGTNLIHGNATDKIGTFEAVPPDNP